MDIKKPARFLAAVFLGAALGLAAGGGLAMLADAYAPTGAKGGAPKLAARPSEFFSGGSVNGPSPFLRRGAMARPEAPKPPGVPEQPKGKEAGGGLAVLGVIPPDVVILSKEGKTVTARSGEKTEVGSVGAITEGGAYVDGRFVALN